MERYLICLAIAMICGLLMSRLAKKLHLPAVTAYLVAGLLLGPFCIGRLNVFGLGFHTLEEVEAFNILTKMALGFIAFTIGNEFRLSQLKTMGKQAIVVGIMESTTATVLVDIALITLHFLRPDLLSLPSAIVLGAIAAATAPAATLMVVRQYKADGPLTRLLLLVVALDDAVGLVLFSASFGIAQALERGTVSVTAVILEPIIEIIFSLALGAAMGGLLHLLERFFHSRSKRMAISVGFVMLTVGLSTLEFNLGSLHCGFSLLLVCMMTGTIFCNICDFSEELMQRVEGWTVPLNILFFVLSGAELNLDILSNPMVLLVGLVYILFRSLGKYWGAYSSCRLTHCNPSISKNLGVTLQPQAGVALGMALTATELANGAMVRSVVLFGVLIYELVGPAMTKRALTAAGEIRPEGKTSARNPNPDKPVFDLRQSK